MYLLDTNVCLDFLLLRNRAVADAVGRHYGSLTVSAITAAELRVGNRNSSKPADDARQLEIFLANVIVAPFDDVAATHYGTLSQAVALKRRSFDRLIGAHALSLNLPLVTNNEADFADIPGLKVENWTQ